MKYTVGWYLVNSTRDVISQAVVSLHKPVETADELETLRKEMAKAMGIDANDGFGIFAPVPSSQT